MKKNWKKIIIVVAIVLVGYYWYQKTHSTSQAVTYKTTAASKGSLVTSVSGSGNVIVDQLATVDPTISGTVANLNVNVGDEIKKGQTLFTIVNNDLSVSAAKSNASLVQAQNAVDSAELSVKQAKADYDAAKKADTQTSKQIKVLKDKIDLAEQGVTLAQQNLSATQADNQNQLSIAGERKVTAPIAGTVSAINVKNGDALGKVSNTTSTAPIVIGDLNTLKANVQVNEVDIPNVAIGQKVMMTFSAIEGLTVTGKVEKIDALGTVSQGVVTYNVKVGFDSIDSRIKPQMSVSAKIITNVKQDVITVPNGALKNQGNATYVEVLNSGAKTPERRMIEIGAANSTDTEIVSGINVGDNVVTQTIDPNAKTTTTGTSGSNGFRGIGGFGGGGRGG